MAITRKTQAEIDQMIGIIENIWNCVDGIKHKTFVRALVRGGMSRFNLMQFGFNSENEALNKYSVEKFNNDLERLNYNLFVYQYRDKLIIRERKNDNNIVAQFYKKNSKDNNVNINKTSDEKRNFIENEPVLIENQPTIKSINDPVISKQTLKDKESKKAVISILKKIGDLVADGIYDSYSQALKYYAITQGGLVNYGFCMNKFALLYNFEDLAKDLEPYHLRVTIKSNLFIIEDLDLAAEDREIHKWINNVYVEKKVKKIEKKTIDNFSCNRIDNIRSNAEVRGSQLYPMPDLSLYTEPKETTQLLNQQARIIEQEAPTLDITPAKKRRMNHDQIPANLPSNAGVNCYAFVIPKNYHQNKSRRSYSNLVANQNMLFAVPDSYDPNDPKTFEVICENAYAFEPKYTPAFFAPTNNHAQQNNYSRQQNYRPTDVNLPKRR